MSITRRPPDRRGRERKGTKPRSICVRRETNLSVVSLASRALQSGQCNQSVTLVVELGFAGHLPVIPQIHVYTHVHTGLG